MKTKRFITFVFAFMFMASSLVFSQDRGQRYGRGMNPDKMLENLKTKLELSDQQVADINVVFENQKKKRDEMRDSGLSREEMREKMQSMRDEQNKAIMEILNTDQQKKYKEMMEKMENRRGSRGNRNKQK